MESSLKNDWVKALRSGEYVQTQEVLYNPVDDAYCCLGVLCEIHPKIKRIDYPDITYEYNASPQDILEQVEIVAENNNYSLPPNITDLTVIDKCVLEIYLQDNELNPFFLHKLGLTHEQQLTLVKMNDGINRSSNASFLEIADWIEENL